jgi:hypothetical protein
MNEERLKQIQQEAEAKAQEMVKAAFGDDLIRTLDEMRDGLSKMEASNRDLRRQIEVLNIYSGLHKYMRVAARHGQRVPVASIADAAFNHNERTPQR